MASPHGLQLVVGPQSQIVVAGLLDGASRSFGLRLMDGVAGVLLDREGGDGVEVRTPSAVAAVRSTEWAMGVGDGASVAFARGGTVFVTAEGGRVQPGAGIGVEVTRDGVVGPVQRLGRPRIDRLADLLGAGW